MLYSETRNVLCLHKTRFSETRIVLCLQKTLFSKTDNIKCLQFSDTCIVKSSLNVQFSVLGLLEVHFNKVDTGLTLKSDYCKFQKDVL